MSKLYLQNIIDDISFDTLPAKWRGFDFEGAVVLVQDNKPLYPFGYPYAYKMNHHHQYILNFRKV